MIKYQLLCDSHHDFEGWFRDSADFDRQAEKCLLACPLCGSADVRKAVMAPSIARGAKDRKARLDALKGDIVNAAQRARDYVEKNFDYVGERFPEEARRIHYGESEARGIFGEATGKEAMKLVEEGVRVAPLPGAETKSAGLSGADKKKLN